MKTNNTYKVSVNQKLEWLLNPKDLQELDIVQLPNGNYHLLYKQQSFKITIHQLNLQEHQMEISLNDELFHLQITPPLQQLIEKMGLNPRPHHQSGEILAPMPGLIYKLEVQKGQNIQKDQTLLILEAMKMENIIKAEGEGTVAEIYIEEGQTVNKGELLLRIE